MKNVRVLIVEDEVIIAMEIESTLKNLGYEVIAIVDNGEKAIQKAESEKPDIILMDIRIKGNLDGIEVADIIRKRYGIPVIFSTAYLDSERIERAKITMPFGYILKPIQERDLKVAVEMALYVTAVDEERREVERKLQQNEEDLNITLKSIGDGVIATDIHGIVTRMNNVAQKLTGWQIEEAKGKSLLEIFHIVNAHTGELAVNPVTKVLETGKIVGLANHTVLISKDGTQYQIADSASPIMRSDGEVTGVVLVFRDVTEEYQLQEKIIESEQQFRSLYNSMIEGVCLHEMVYDESGKPWNYRITNINPQFEKIIRIKKADVVGKLATDAYQAEQAPYLDVYAKVAETGEPAVFETYFPPMDKHFSISVFSPGKGKFATVFEDITQRKKVLEDLQQIKWLLTRHSSRDDFQEPTEPKYGDLVQLNTNRRILDSVGKELLHDIVNDYLELLETSSAIYEKNGDYALGLFSSGWCRLLDQSSRELCNTKDNKQALNCGKWLCHESCWTAASKTAIENCEPVDVPCNGGLRLYAVPVTAAETVIGAINFGYGSPPKEPDRLKMIAEKYQIDVDVLKKYADEYETRPPFIIEMAKKRLKTSAKLIGRIVENSRAVGR